MDEWAATERAIETYTATLVLMAELPSRAGVADSAREWNRLVNELQRQRLMLRDAPPGQAAVSALMDDPRPVVCQWAAGHALFWDEPKARSVLESLRDAYNAGVVATNARYTLIEFDQGA